MPESTLVESAVKTGRPPGPYYRFKVSAGLEATKNYLKYFTWCAREFGDLVFIPFLGLNTVFVNHPDYIESILVTNYQKFHKSRDYRALNLLLGNGLVTSEGEFWRRQRKLSQPGFHRERIAAYSGIMADSAATMLAGWTSGETRDIHADMMGLTLDVVAKCLFRADVSKVSAVVGEALHIAMTQYVVWAKMGFLIPQWIPTPGNRRYRKAVRRLDEIVYRIIGEHRERGESGDLLGMLMAARDDDGSPMTDQQLRDEVMTLFLAGHETTANALAWTLYLLSQNPEVEVRLQAELASVLRGRPPVYSDLGDLRYTSMVVKEGLRLYPPVWGIGRQAIEPFELGGYSFEKGTYVFLCQYITQRDSRYFPDPERFLPERWSDERQIQRFTYFPFGAGPRVCIGAGFAQMEATLLLAAIAQRFRLALEPGHPVVPLTSVTMRPKYGMRMKLSQV